VIALIGKLVVWLSYRYDCTPPDGWSHKPKDCIGTPMAFESQVKTSSGFCNRTRTAYKKSATSHYRANYWLAETPELLKVSGGSKKHWCHRAASDNEPAFHCFNVGNVAAIIPPSAESKISTTPARS
jgi:hypothetical protein